MENLLIPPCTTGSEYINLGTFITRESLLLTESEECKFALNDSNLLSPGLNDSKRLVLAPSDSTEFNMIDSDELKLVSIG